MTQYNAARAAGYSTTYINTKSLEAKARDSLRDLMQQRGLTDQYLIDYIKEGLSAMKPYGNDGELFPDWQVRHKFLELVLKLSGRMNEVNIFDNSVNTNLTLIQKLHEKRNEPSTICVD